MKKLLSILVCSLFSLLTYAQHDHQHDHKKPAKKDTAKQQSPKPAVKDASKPSAGDQLQQDTIPNKHPDGAHDHDTPQKAATTGHDHTATSGTHDHEDMNMSHAFSRNLPMTRNGSGTAWLPDNSPMYGYMFHSGKWMYMLHGDVYLRYNKQDLLDKGTRGGSKVDAPNMVMMMGQRPVSRKGLFRFSSMLSLDPITVGGGGYPLLFQTGETHKGQPLVDRQHPHDFFSELSVGYTHSFSPYSDVFLYVGYPGEPALGPTAYVHRPSGMFNPDAPLTHHWVDATHITFGVATLGFRYNNWKIEASSFTGREPNEQRFNFDKPRFDSWSGRLSYNPTEKWAMQVSHGFIKEPELLHPGENVNRSTASVTYSNRGYGEQFTNITALWGRNKTAHDDPENGLLLEGSYIIKRTAVYSRYEWVQKSAEELRLDEAHFDHHTLFPIHSFTAGASYDIFSLEHVKIALGGQLSFYNPDQRLSKLYGENPIAGQVYLRLYPKVMGKRSGSIFIPY